METQEAGTSIPPEVQQQIDQIGHQAVQEHLQTNLAALEHIENPQERRQDGFTPEFVGDSERVQGHMARLAEVTLVAHEQVASENQTTEEPPAGAVWLRAATILSERAVEAKKANDAETAQRSAEDLLVVISIAAGNSEYDDSRLKPDEVDRVVEAAVGNGLAEELVNAQVASRGLVTIKDDEDMGIISKQYYPVEATIAEHRGLLQVAIGQKIDFDNEGARTSLAPEEWQAQMEKLPVPEKAAVAKSLDLETDQDKQEAISRAVLVPERWHSTFGSIDVDRESLLAMIDIDPGFREGKYDDLLRLIRQKRMVGGENRFEASYFADELIVSLWSRGDKRLAQQLLTVRDGEISDDGYGAITNAARRIQDRGRHEPFDTGEVLADIGQDIEARRQQLIERIAELNDHPNVSSIFLHQNTVFSKYDPEAYADRVLANADSLEDMMADPDMLRMIEEASYHGSKDDFAVAVLTNPVLADLLSNPETRKLVSHDFVMTPYHLLKNVELLSSPRVVETLLENPDIYRYVMYDKHRPEKTKALISLFEHEAIKLLIDDESQRANVLKQLSDKNAETIQAALEAFDNPSFVQMLEDPRFTKLGFRIAIEHPDEAPAFAEAVLKSEDLGMLVANQVIADRIIDMLVTVGLVEEFNAKVAEVSAIFSHPREYWKNIYSISEVVHGLKVEHSQNNHTIKFLPKIRLKPDQLRNGNGFLDAVEGFSVKDIADMTEAERKALLTPEAIAELGDQIMEVDSFTFQQFNPEVRKQIYGYMISETLRRSRDPAQKMVASHRNRERVHGDTPVFTEGDFIHGAPLDALLMVLQDGNFAGESRSVASKEDAFPFNVDVSIIQYGPDTRSQVEETITGAGYSYGGSDGVILVYARDDNSWMAGQTSNPTSSDRVNRHGLILGGIPSTEITGVILRDANEHTINSALEATIQNGVYIPIYDLDGNLLVTPAEFDAVYGDRNMVIQVPTTIDSTLRTDEQLGSNEGSVYLLPTETGRPQKHYIKFGGLRTAQVDEGEVAVSTTDHIWTEYLADTIYERMGVTTPRTRMVTVEGRIGHDSEWVDETTDSPPSREVTTLNGGFVVDAWLANWDVVYNAGNTLEVDGIVYRADNGGALDLRAQGQRKSGDVWNDEVLELRVGDNDERLGLGMRQKYPGLTDEEVRAQAQDLRTKMTDAAIDQMVDSIRRPKADRDQLKATLKARRDYIVRTVLT